MRALLPLIPLLAGLAGAAPEAASRPRYVFLFVGDGMGAAQVALAEAWKASLGDSLGFAATSFTGFPVLGSVTTHCAVRRTTESAAAATALASGTKAGEKAIGVDVAGRALRTLAEEARDAGAGVGLLTTVPVNHATPAGFYAHVDSRDRYGEIGRQLAESRMDLFAGGGFQEDTGLSGRRASQEARARARGYRIARGRAAAEALDSLPALLLSSDPGDGTLPWAMDPRPADMPRLADYVRAAIRLLEPKGRFFVMAEGGKVDWGCHGNDARAAIGEVWDLDSAVRVALEFGKRHPRETLILVTADHETGGLTLGNGGRGYETEFGLLGRQSLSQERMADSLGAWLGAAARLGADPGALRAGALARVARWTGLGSDPRLPLSREDSLELSAGWQESQRSGAGLPLAKAAVRLLGRKAGVGWTTGAHTAAPVPLHAWGAGAEAFAGRLDNTDIPRRIRALVDWTGRQGP